jgi:hypothetical protein
MARIIAKESLALKANEVKNDTFCNKRHYDERST